MTQSAEIPDYNENAETGLNMDKAADSQERMREVGDVFSVDTKCPETRIALETARFSLLQQHASWIDEAPRKVGFDPNMIQVAMIEDLLNGGRTDLGRLASQLEEGYGCYLPHEKMDYARDEVKRMLEKGN